MFLLSDRLPIRSAAALALAAGILLSGCSSINPWAKREERPRQTTAGVKQTVEESKSFGLLPVYRPNVQQGNFVSREMVDQLKVGMTPDQVRFILGTPLIVDVFHGERWDYPFLMKRGDGTVMSSHVVVRFKDGRVASFDGGQVPEESQYLKLIAAPEKK
jgi:outer membrane protein assembly factor BamE